MIPGYEVGQEVPHNEQQSLHRGVRVADRCAVWLKQPRREQPNAHDCTALEREYALLQSLSLPGIPVAIELIRNDNLIYLVLEDTGGVLLPASRRCELDEFFQRALPLVAVVAELHRHEISHQNLHPQGMLFDAARGVMTLTDFSHATRGVGEQAAPLPAQLSRQHLAYLAPEQTGRMNRAVDYRADFYSLGVIFYEWLTGGLPFYSADALELIHWHIAKTPAAPADLDPTIPPPLSRLVMKLLAKTAEERYQSAAGLHADLQRCAAAWQEQRHIAPFALGEHDVTDRFLIPQKLYGRARETAQVLESFEQVCQGRTTLLLATGTAGIGKTALIRELDKPIVRQRGYFIAGKFDQVVRGVPFGALIQALRGLVRQLLGESESELAAWRTRLTAALGANGGVLAEVIPEIALIVGPQAAPPVLGATETLNRFQLVFQNFIGALARPEHPLVIFLDDLQWADAATLGLLQPLLTTPDIQCLLLLGAYRDNEVEAAHGLSRTLTALSETGAHIQRVTLEPLPLDDLTQLIGDALHNEAPDAAPLARLVQAKTAGNPFFVTQFLQRLKQDGLLAFDHQQRRWTYHLADIESAPLTDNVIELMTQKIQRMPFQTQHVLTLAACIGSPFDRATLAHVSGQTTEALLDNLSECLKEGLILRASGDSGRLSPDATPSYVFLHDRVQQAAYAMIPAHQRQLVHLMLGRLLRERATTEQSDKGLFDLVHHLNLGSALIEDPEERLSLARLNLDAGRKAKASAAHEAALGYLQTGLTMLDETHWQSDYELSFALQLDAAECLHLCGQFKAAEKALAALLPRVASKLDQARVLNLRIIQHESQGRYHPAVASGRECLALFGVGFPEHESDILAAVEREVAAIERLRGTRAIAALRELPVMSDAEMRMVMHLVATIWSSAYISGQQALTRLFSATLVRLSLEHGNAPESAYGYATHTITVGPVLQDYAAAYEFGRLALAVNEAFDDRRWRAKIYQQFHAHANFWRQPFHTCLPYAREASRSGFESGDVAYGIYGAYTESWAAMFATQELAQFVRTYTPNVALFQKLKAAPVADGQQALLNCARALRGETRDVLSLTTEEFDEAAYLANHRDNPFFALMYYAGKLQLAVHFGADEQALEYARAAQQLAPKLLGTVWPAMIAFWHGMALAANYDNAPAGEQAALARELNEIQTMLATLGEHCPENFRGLALLLDAEAERCAGREMTTLNRYERAISYAAETGQLQYQGLANEHCARFWLQRGQDKIAAVFFAEAHAAYTQWGATAKAAALEREHAAAFKTARATEAREFTAFDAGALDLFSVTKAAQTIASEMELEALLAKLLRISIENAGAERGTLVLEHAGEPFIHAEGTLATLDIRTHQPLPLAETQHLPLHVINYVRRTGESVILAEATQDATFGADPFIQQQQPRSMLCAPVMQQGKLIGVFYLENNQAAGAFTPERTQVMQVLAAQAAISLENARLYEETKQEAEQRRQAEQTLRSIMEGTAAATGDNFFASLVRHLATALHVRYAFVTECRETPKTKARTLAFWQGERLGDNVSYEIAETPCLKVLAGETCYYAAGVQRLFPRDTDLVAMHAEGYLGIPLCAANGEVIGHLAVLDDKPMTETPQGLSLLNIFAARAGAELERQHADAELRVALAEVERLKNQLHAENLYLQEEIRRVHNFDEIIGSSPALVAVLRQVESIAPADSTAIIYGETGTGKELIARVIHDRSPRQGRPLVKVNCGAISAGLVESELFGHVKGAFTGAIDKRTGRFELADGGTLFLDEIGELSLETQVKLLRVLQESEFEPVGSSKTIKVNVRVIAATHRNLAAEVQAGRFRADLYYRLNVLPLTLPPLRERRDDIPQLVTFFLERFARKFNKPIEGVAQETMQLLCDYAWPGNIRELQNIIERGVALARHPILILEPQSLSATVAEPTPRAQAVAATAHTNAAPPQQVSATPASLDETQRQHILAVLRQTRGVIEGPGGAALILNLHPNTLRSRMKKLGIQRTDYLAS
jgi:predicted ATPase/transcriptional regulator with GAF, ATPase, and Fis domain